MKMILLLLALVPAVCFGQVKNDTLSVHSGVLLQDASADMVTGLTLCVSGAAFAGLSVAAASVNFLGERNNTATVIGGAVIGSAMVITGTVITYRGYLKVGKAGKALEVELSPTKLAISF